ncbi:MAG: YhfC family glutamic-type intramembrane protease [Micropruina sp.]|uniref:YhfC family glutamic-type intramembrane protease n=1 Tax=Micropruina sp. TaxID=2737536 RepID=UPI0039E5F658
MVLSVPQLLAVAVELALMIVLPVAAAAWWCRRRGVPASVPLIAAGCYLLNLVVNVPLTAVVYPRLGLAPLLTLGLTALTYGVCEELARWLSFRIGSLRRHRDADGGIAAGIGHGGTEAIMFGLPYLVGTFSLLLAPASVPEATRAQLSAADPLLFIGTGLDRLPAMAAHLVFALLIVLAYRKGPRFLLLAIVAHAGIDFVMFALRDLAPTPVFVGAWTLTGLLALALAVLLWRRSRAGAV